MPRFRLAVATRTWALSLLDAIRAAAETGASGVLFDVRHELPPAQLSDTGRRDLLHVLRERGLQVAATSFPLRYPLAAEHQLERRLAALREAMQFTYRLGAETLCVPSGRCPDDLASPAGQHWKEVLSDLARYGNHVGVALALTPAGETPERLKALVTSITTGPIGIDFDPAQCVHLGQSTSESLRQLYGLIRHVQLRDGVRHLSGGGEETAVGQGAVDWLELLALLSEMEYPGWLTAIRLTGDDRPRDVARAVRQVQRWLMM